MSHVAEKNCKNTTKSLNFNFRSVIYKYVYCFINDNTWFIDYFFILFKLSIIYSNITGEIY